MVDSPCSHETSRKKTRREHIVEGSRGGRIIRGELENWKSFAAKN